MNGCRERGASIGLGRRATQNEAPKASARPKLITSLFGGRCIDICLRFRYIQKISLTGTRSGCDPQCGASAVLPRGLATRAGAASGIIPFGITAEAWGAATALGRDRAGNARLIFDPGSMAWS
jgi:hypothetical protein